MNGFDTALGALLGWLAMGGYGLYVWGSLLMCAAVFAGELLALRAQRLALAAELREVDDAGPARAGRPAPRRAHTLTPSEAEA